jgi:aldehyde:ferredoxin oxidoreductase
MIDTRDPMGSTHGYVQDMTKISPFGQDVLDWEQLQALGERIYGASAAMDPLSDYEGKAEPALWHARRSMIKDSLPLCDRTFPRLFTSLTDDGLPRVDSVDGPDFEAHLYRLVTGHEVDSAELERSAERALTVERLEQLRDFGRTRETDDGVLDFFCDTLEEYTNPLLGDRKRAQRDPLTELATSFYALRGWDTERGLPTRERIESLGLSHTLEELEQHKSKVT